MAFPTSSWKHLQPSCMGMQYRTTSCPQAYTSLSTNKNTLDVQCYTSPQDSLSTNNNPLDYIISSGLLQDYEQMPIEGYSTTLAEWIALEAQNQLMNSNNNIEGSNIDWLNTQASNYEYKDAQEPLINSSSTISSTTLSPPPHIDQFSNYSFGHKQALANCINDSPPLIHNKPLEIEPKPLDLQLIEQELAIYHNVGSSNQFIHEEMPSNLKCFPQDQMNASSLFCDGAPSFLLEQKSMHPHEYAENIININAPSSICRSTISNSCTIAHKFPAGMGTEEDLEERDNAVVKREERENEDMFGYSSMNQMLIQLAGERRETDNKKRCREERETRGVGKRENKCISEKTREERREKNYIGDEREESMRRYNGSCLLEVKRENVGRKRGRESYVCKRGNSEDEEEVILVRARRGQATDSHSLAERVRRERISQRMKLLQELVPSCTKVLGKAAVLEEIINYVKSLQQQIEFLSMRLATTDYQKRFQI